MEKLGGAAVFIRPSIGTGNRRHQGVEFTKGRGGEVGTLGSSLSAVGQRLPVREQQHRWKLDRKVRQRSGDEYMESAEFEFQADGDHLTGRANIGVGWPGRAEISRGTIDGEHISFTVFGTQPSSDRYPKMEFAGSIQGDEIKLTMTFYPYVNKESRGKTEFAGKRSSRRAQQ
jgi:hypothetical protein